jgi:RHS repeat-associated protein
MSPGIVAESDLTGNLTSEYVFFGGRRMARRDFSSSPPSVSYYFSDELQTADVITDSAGNIKSESDYYPYGGELPFVSNDSNRYKYKGDERDNETGLDKMGVRYYSSSLSRFVTPDPLYLEMRRLTDPQQLNLYTYGRNNPLRFSDDTGLDIKLNCEGGQQDCNSAVSDLNKRENAQFTVGLDKNNKLTPGNADPTTLGESELALYNAITDTGHTGTLNIAGDTGQSEFGTHDSPGVNTVDLGNMSKLDQPGNKGGLNSGTAIAHEALDAYFSVNTAAGKADHLSSGFFPGLTPVISGQVLSNVQEVYGQSQVQRVTDGRGSERIVIILNTPIPKTDLEGKTAAQRDKMFVDAGSRVSKVTFDKGKQ